jgi:pyruvate,water dikinase
MNNEFVTLANDKGIRILSPKEKDIFKKAIEEKDDHGKEIKGNVASKGPEETYKAKVKILNSSHECSKVEDGEFLVATMTTPDYVPAMKKAIGFITDEGGITCHAAIIAREMNKPCVIGTKNATKVLKDGDVVEVNVKSGTVKVIK